MHPCEVGLGRHAHPFPPAVPAPAGSAPRGGWSRAGLPRNGPRREQGKGKHRGSLPGTGPACPGLASSRTCLPGLPSVVVCADRQLPDSRLPDRTLLCPTAVAAAWHLPSRWVHSQGSVLSSIPLAQGLALWRGQIRLWEGVREGRKASCLLTPRFS